MNKAILIGRLTRDPEMRTTTSGINSTTFTVAVSRNYTSQSGERETDFINCVAWRKQAENVKNYLSQGSQVAIDGRIQTRSYDGEDGKKRYVTEVVADNVEFLGTKGSNTNSNNNSSGFTPNQEPTPYDFSNEKQGTNVDSNPFADFGSSIEISDDELPF